MRKIIVSVLTCICVLASVHPAMALLRKDLGYVVGTVHSKQESSKEIVIKDESGSMIKFTADDEQYNSVQVGNNVLVSHPLNSNHIFGIFVRQ